MSVTIIGAGISGLTASIHAAELGEKVFLISPDYSERSQSVMAMGGINASLKEYDSVMDHYNDTMKGGVYLNNPKAVSRLCTDAPIIIKWLSSIGTSFTHNNKGEIDVRAFGGQENMRTAYAGARTGKQIVTSLINKVREEEINNNVKRFIGWHFLSLILDNDICLGVNIIKQDTGEIRQILSDSVIICTGGLNKLFGRTSGSIQNDAYTTAKLFTQGVELANLEMIQYHPTTIKTSSKRMLITEAARGEGGKLYINTPEGKFYFMREWYPELKELMPRDIVSQSIYKVCETYNQENVYLDLRELDENIFKTKLDEVYEVSKTFLGLNPKEKPIPVYPGIHYFMGGILTDENHKTNIKGLFAAGESSCQYHGANRLGGNSLLGAVHGGIIAAKEANKIQKQKHEKEYLINETQYPEFNEKIPLILNKTMGIYRNQEDLTKAINKIKTLPPTVWTILAEAILKSALERKESRGAHQRTDYPETLEKYQKTTITRYRKDKIKIEFRRIK